LLSAYTAVLLLELTWIPALAVSLALPVRYKLFDIDGLTVLSKTTADVE
jgi:hypothetical protein